MSSGAPLLVGASGWIGSGIEQVMPTKPCSARSVLASKGAILHEEAAESSVIINAGGARSGGQENLRRFNRELPEILARFAARTGVFVIHLGSASEYGFPSDAKRIAETASTDPTSEYGRTKLAGTQAIQRDCNSVAFRIFNISHSPPQPGSPLADIAERVRMGIEANEDVKILSAETTRDWIDLEFLTSAISWAAKEQVPGLFNVCLGVGISMRQIVEESLRGLNADIGVNNLLQFPPNTVVGDPTQLRQASGISAQLDSISIGGTIIRSLATN